LADSTQFEAERSGVGIELWPVNNGGGKEAGSMAHANGTVPATLP
jgi:hypothetical protein